MIETQLQKPNKSITIWTDKATEDLPVNPINDFDTL
jgi:hypothetical protein